MYAGLLWCACVIVVLIADLRTMQERRLGIDHVHEHVGQKNRADIQIDGDGERRTGLAHRGHLERLSPTKEFVIDLGDFFQDLSNLGVVGQMLADSLEVGLADVVHLR